MRTQFGQYSGFQDPGPKTADFSPSGGPPPDNKNQSRMAAKSVKMNPPNSRLDNFLAVAPKVENQSLKSRFHDFLTLAPEIERINPKICWFWCLASRRWQNESWKCLFDDFVALAPESDTINPKILDLMTLQPRSTSQQNESQKSRCNDFLALAPKINKIKPRNPDLIVFWPWLWELPKSIPEISICWSSGLGSRSGQNQSQTSKVAEHVVWELCVWISQSRIVIISRVETNEQITLRNNQIK